MHGTFDTTVSPGETEGYKRLVEKALGHRGAERFLAVYYIPGMGHGGTQFNDLVGEQIDALEAWIDYLQSGGRRRARPREDRNLSARYQPGWPQWPWARR